MKGRPMPDSFGLWNRICNLRGHSKVWLWTINNQGGVSYNNPSSVAKSYKFVRERIYQDPQLKTTFVVTTKY
jgi:hypothetical protein